MNINKQIDKILDDSFFHTIERDEARVKIKQSILKTIMERLNKLMDDKQIAELEKRFKLFSRGWDKKCCPMCGVQPSYQKKLILSVIKDVLETNQNK